MSNTENDDDVWGGSEDEVEYERDLAEKEWGRLQEDHGNTGYKEGIVVGKEVNMQRGFDRGYAEGLAVGKEIGKLRGVLSTYITFYSQIMNNQDAANELTALFDKVDKTEAQHVYSVDYFREDGPTCAEKYVTPEAFVFDLNEKVNAALTAVNEKYQDRS